MIKMTGIGLELKEVMVPCEKKNSLPRRSGTREKTKAHSGNVRVTAVLLAVTVALSALCANVESVVRLLDVKAVSALESEKYYNATVKLFDYYNDNDSNEQQNNVYQNSQGGYDKKGQLFYKFNTCLYRKAYPGISRSYVENAAYTQIYDRSTPQTLLSDYAVREFTPDDGNDSTYELNSLLADDNIPAVGKEGYQTYTHPNTYYPLYLGWQNPNGNDKDAKVYRVGGSGNYSLSNELITNPTRYTYTTQANSYGIDDFGEAATQNLVNATLSEDGFVTQGSGASLVTIPYFNEDFLTTEYTIETSGQQNNPTASVNYTPGKVYDDKTFRFKYHPTTDTSDPYRGYYVFDSSADGIVKDNANLDDATMLTTVTSGSAAATEAGSSFERYLDEKNAFGFFPVGEKNFGFGAKFSINFTMTKDGINPLTNEHMKFNFRGDDDVWVFIDDELMLDIGGAHGAVGGYIDFADGIAHVNDVKKPTALSFSDWGTTTVAGVSNVIKSQCTVAIGKNDYVYSDSTHTDTNIRSKLEKKGLYDDPTETHTLTVFYIERGRNESNCLITFNFQQADTLTVRNKELCRI